MKIIQRISFCMIGLGFLFILVACGPVTNSTRTGTKAVKINPSFQAQMSPVPTEATYACGAWSSNNTPGPDSTISIYARLTKNVMGVSGANATAIVHFQSGDVQLDNQPSSDSGGFVTFQLSLGGRQPVNVPATVDVSFTNVPGHSGSIHCQPAFFTPI